MFKNGHSQYTLSVLQDCLLHGRSGSVEKAFEDAGVEEIEFAIIASKLPKILDRFTMCESGRCIVSTTIASRKLRTTFGS